MFTVDRFPVNVFTLCKINKYYFTARIHFDASTPELDPPKHVYYLTFSFAILGLFIENVSRF